MVSWCCSLSTLWRGARENSDKSPGPLNQFNSLILVMCIMHSPTTGIWYYVHVPFRFLKFWFITGRIISHPVWHASCSSLTVGLFFCHSEPPANYDESEPMPLIQPAICIGLCKFSMLCWQFHSQSNQVRQRVTIRARDWWRTITACAGVRVEGFLVAGKSCLFPWASNARIVVENLGRGRAWTVIVDTAIPSVHHVLIPWTLSPCHWHNEEIHTRGLFAFMTPTVCAPTCIFLRFPRLFCLHFAKFACHNMYKCVIKVIIV